MKKLLLTTVALLAISAPAHALSPSEIGKRQVQVCSGDLWDMRRIGLQIGGCDLNSISNKELKWITQVCGQPGGIDKVPPYCRIEATVELTGETCTDVCTVQAKVLKVQHVTNKFRFSWEPKCNCE